MFMNYLGHGIFPKSTRDFQGSEAAKLIAFKTGGGYIPSADSAIQGLHGDGDLGDKSGGVLLSLASGIAELPVKDDGEWPQFTTTQLRDVGRFVAASLDLPEWQEDMSIAGSTLTMGELLEAAEKITGKKIKVTKITREDLEKQQAALDPEEFMAQLWIEFKLNWIKDESGYSILSPIVNGLCPDVKPISAVDFLKEHWEESQQV